MLHSKLQTSSLCFSLCLVHSSSSDKDAQYRIPTATNAENKVEKLVGKVVRQSATTNTHELKRRSGIVELRHLH